jgi:hypothetical protein
MATELFRNWLMIMIISTNGVTSQIVTKEQCQAVMREVYNSGYNRVSCVSPDGKHYTKLWSTKEPI